MAPISFKKISIFETQLIDLIDHFINKGYTTENQEKLIIEQQEHFWNSSSPEEYPFKLYQIALESLCKSLKLSSDKPLLPGQLIRTIDRLLSQDSIKDLAKSQVLDQNRITQRRLYLTPTVLLVAPMEVE